jgi:polyisoprenoid-binding protein YceI
MARYDPGKAEVLVFTFKEGMLSAMAHDLKIRVERFSLEIDEASASGTFDATSLKVVNPMKNGADNPGVLPTLLYSEIEKNIQGDVLETKRFAEVKFKSTSLSPTEVAGELTLHGQTRAIRGTRNGNAVEFELDQRDFGIKPYSAMFGTLKVQPKVKVTVRLLS